MRKTRSERTNFVFIDSILIYALAFEWKKRILRDRFADRKVTGKRHSA